MWEEPVATVPQNQESEISLDWTALYGELPSGTYAIRMLIHDFFSPSAVNSMMKDFTDEQLYQIDFTIE